MGRLAFSLTGFAIPDNGVFGESRRLGKMQPASSQLPLVHALPRMWPSLTRLPVESVREFL